MTNVFFGCFRAGPLHERATCSKSTILKVSLLVVGILIIGCGAGIYFGGAQLMPQVFSAMKTRLLVGGIVAGAGALFVIGAFLVHCMKKREVIAKDPAQRAVNQDPHQPNVQKPVNVKRVDMAKVKKDFHERFKTVQELQKKNGELEGRIKNLEENDPRTILPGLKDELKTAASQLTDNQKKLLDILEQLCHGIFQENQGSNAYAYVAVLKTLVELIKDPLSYNSQRDLLTDVDNDIFHAKEEFQAKEEKVLIQQLIQDLGNMPNGWSADALFANIKKCYQSIASAAHLKREQNQIVEATQKTQQMRKDLQALQNPLQKPSVDKKTLLNEMETYVNKVSELLKVEYKDRLLHAQKVIAWIAFGNLDNDLGVNDNDLETYFNYTAGFYNKIDFSQYFNAIVSKLFDANQLITSQVVFNAFTAEMRRFLNKKDGISQVIYDKKLSVPHRILSAACEGTPKWEKDKFIKNIKDSFLEIYNAFLPINENHEETSYIQTLEYMTSYIKSVDIRYDIKLPDSVAGTFEKIAEALFKVYDGMKLEPKKIFDHCSQLQGRLEKYIDEAVSK